MKKESLVICIVLISISLVSANIFTDAGNFFQGFFDGDAEGLEGELATKPVSCSDTDGGINYGVYGICSSGSSMSDACVDGQLLETYCQKVRGKESCAIDYYDCSSEGKVCEGGKCVSTCAPESNTQFCTRLNKECGSVTDYDNCGTLRTGVNCGTCGTGETCSNGVCVAECTDDTGCSSAGNFCDGDTPYTCSLGGDGCLDRTNQAACLADETCSGGVCVATCTPGWKCKDSMNRAYQYSDCSWVAITYCEYGCDAGTGNCNSAPSCTDECSSGQKICVGNSYKTCGNYDADECLELSSLTDCGEQTCVDGECVGGGETDYTPRTCNIDGSATGSTCLGVNEDETDATIDGCVDGPDQNSLGIDDISISATKVLTTDNVQVTCDVKCLSSSTKWAIAYNSGDGWENIYYGACSAAGIEPKIKTIEIEDIPGTHYFRCMERYYTEFTGTETCSEGYYFDNDDMSIEVISGTSPTTYTLTTNVNPSGSGSVIKNPNKVNYNLGETVQLTATPYSGYTFSSWGGSVTGTSNPISIIMNSNKAVTANFASSKPTVTITATDATAGEPSDNGAFRVTRTGSTASNLRAYYSTTGSTATSGSDYSALSGYVDIPIGQSSATILVNVIDDATVESPETVKLIISSNANYNIGSPSSATVTIADDDEPSGEGGEIVAWGLDNYYGIVSNIPAGNDFAAVASGGNHNVALKVDGSLVAWGKDTSNQVSDTPAGNDFVAVSAGSNHNVALKSDGSIAAWGDDSYNQVGHTPAGNDFVAVAAGQYHSLALKSDGSLIAWGRDFWLQISNVPTGNNFIAVAAGPYDSAALRADGSLVEWGMDTSGQVSDTPAGNDFVSVSVGEAHSVALKSDGSLVAWGSNTYGQVSDTPVDKEYTSISAYSYHSTAIKQSGEPTCTSECSSGEKSCVGNSYKTCIYNAEGCWEWSGLTDCGAKTCVNGQCVNTIEGTISILTKFMHYYTGEKIEII